MFRWGIIFLHLGLVSGCSRAPPQISQQQVPPSLGYGVHRSLEQPPNTVLCPPSPPILGGNRAIKSPTETVDKLLTDLPSQPTAFQQSEELQGNSWQQKCQEYAESIEKLEDRLAVLKPVAAVGSAWLRRWYIHSPGTVDSSTSDGSFAPVLFDENQKTEAQWQELAAKQGEAIANFGEFPFRCYFPLG